MSGVRSLLMGGQACVLYGGAEFSRDTDVLVLADDANLERLAAALDVLEADVILVPPFERRHLKRGLAVHFRCRAPGAAGMRVDVMATLRGLPGFETLWDRRTTIETDGGAIEVLSLRDLVTAKKTQRDKDWPMIARLVEADLARHGEARDAKAVALWLEELRTPSLLIGLARELPDATTAAIPRRPLLTHALAGDAAALTAALRVEEDAEREADRLYWAPRRLELEQIRLGRRGPA
jgi:hypothetical protein